jgi:hypothetical protein
MMTLIMLRQTTGVKRSLKKGALLIPHGIFYSQSLVFARKPAGELTTPPDTGPIARLLVGTERNRL